jgi:hypothetical protein
MGAFEVMLDLLKLKKLKDLRDQAQRTEAIGVHSQVDLLARVVLLFIVALADQAIEEAEKKK